MKRDVPRLRALLEILRSAARAAFEFRHESWLSADVLQTVADAGAALCIADTDEGTTPLEATAPFGYLRLRRTTTTAPSSHAGWSESSRSAGTSPSCSSSTRTRRADPSTRYGWRRS